MILSNIFSKNRVYGKYDIDLNYLSCTCPDWIETRQRYEIDNPGRLCKHLISQINLDNLNSELLYYRKDIEFYQKNNLGFKTSFNKVLKIPNTPYRILYNEYADWNDLFDVDANRYAFTLRPYDIPEDMIGSEGCIKWAKDEKPLEYKKVEEFFVGEEFQLPFALSEKEQQDLRFNLQMNFKEKIQEISIGHSQYSNTTTRLYYMLNIIFDKKDELYDLEITNKTITINDGWNEFKFHRKNEDIEYQRHQRLDFIKKHDDEKQKRLNKVKDCDLHYKRPKEILKDYDIPFGLIKFYRLLLKNGYALKTVSRYDNSVRYYPTTKGRKYSKVFWDIFYMKIDTFEELLTILVEDYELGKIKKTKSQKISSICCINCGSYNVNKKGKRKQKINIMQDYQCQDCKKYFSDIVQ